MVKEPKHRVEITGENWSPNLRTKHARPEFTPEDGIASLDSLHQAGDGIVSIGTFVGDTLHAMGSGVMIAPGLLLTATHVMKDFTDGGCVFTSFLPDGAARAWLPYETNTLVGPGNFLDFGMPERKLASDLSLVSCVLMSDAIEHHPLTVMPMEIALPLPGSRLWAVGFRQGSSAGAVDGVIPFLSSGIVTAFYPNGRGRNLASTCVEVAMETPGGMSGGPVFNEFGYVVGVISYSLGSDDHRGPTYVTLIWDALRIGIRCPWPAGTWPDGDIDLFKARDLGLAELKGNVSRDDKWNVSLGLNSAEMQVMIASANSFQAPNGDRDATT